MPKLRGMGASRAGRPALGLQTLIDRIQANAPRRKTAAPLQLAKAKGVVGRVKQLWTGTRHKALETAAKNMDPDPVSGLGKTRKRKALMEKHVGGPTKGHARKFRERQAHEEADAYRRHDAGEQGVEPWNMGPKHSKEREASKSQRRAGQDAAWDRRQKRLDTALEGERKAVRNFRGGVKGVGTAAGVGLVGTGVHKLRKKEAALPVSTDQAQYAQHVLEKSKGRGRRFADATAVGSIGNPVMRMGGRAIQGALNAPRGGRIAGAVGQVRKELTAGHIGRQAFEGGAGGAGIKMMQEGMEVGRAKRTAKTYLGQDKIAVVIPKSVGKARIHMNVGEVWGHGTRAAQDAAAAAGGVAAPAVAKAAPRQFGKAHAAGVALTGVGVGGAYGAGQSTADPYARRDKLARALFNIASKIKPVPLPSHKMSPLIDEDVEFEI